MKLICINTSKSQTASAAQFRNEETKTVCVLQFNSPSQDEVDLYEVGQEYEITLTKIQSNVKSKNNKQGPK